MITKKVDAVTRIPEDALKVCPPIPKAVKIELTNRCNYNCGYCALRTRRVKGKQTIEWDLFTRITQEMRDAGVQEIGVFYLGESFTAPEVLVDAIKWCKIVGFPYVFLTTNGSLAAPAHLRAVMRAGLDSLKFSVNASGDEQFEELMGVRSALFWKMISNLKEARKIREELGVKCGIYASSIQFDGEQQAKMEALLKEHVLPYVDEHYWLPLYSMGSLATKREAELGFRPTAGNQGRIGALRAPIPCWAAFTEGHVTVDGILSACCFDADARWAMGDLKTTPFTEAWHSKKFQALRAAHLRQDVTGSVCEACVAY